MLLRPPLLQHSLSTFSLIQRVSIVPHALHLHSHARFNTDRPPPRAPPPPPPPPPPRAPRDLSSISLSTFFGEPSTSRPRQATKTDTSDPAASTKDLAAGAEFPSFGDLMAATSEENMFHLCVYATKHNTHLSFTKPNKDVIITMSCGNVGFKKSKRGTFEAAYELTSVMLSKIEERKLRPRNLEIVYRDFGPGREAFTKALLGREGKLLRAGIRRVTDVTRLKFGGTRSRATRRL